MEFRLLGPVELRMGAESVDLGSPKQRCVLAILLMSPRRLVRTETLIDQVWGEDPPTEVRGTLYSYVARLRRVLKPIPGVELRRRSGGYQLDLAPEAVDWHRFRQLVESARATGVPDREHADLLATALDLWQGQPLGAIAGDWASHIREGMVRQRLNAAAEWAELELRLGRPVEVADRLTALIEQHPLAEALIAQFMLALARQGRRAEALDCFAKARHRIVAELGVDPGNLLHRVHESILAAETPEPRGPSRRWLGPRGHLDRLIAREEELHDLLRLLDAHRLVTVTGPSGCGKTALAYFAAAQVVEHHRDGVAVLALAAIGSVHQAVAALGVLFGVSGTPGADPVDAIAHSLGTQQVLLLLDNCEHLDDGLAELVERLLASCPALTVLATSRHTLEISGETLLALQPLRLPDTEDPSPAAPAVVFFLERATQALPALRIGAEDLGHVAEICRRLDGLPLALELAAVRLRTLGLAELAGLLRENLEVLARNTARGTTRHRTLIEAIYWSYRLLTPEEQRLLARLSVFAGGFRVADATVVTGFEPLARGHITPLLGALVDKSLLQPYERDGLRRLRLLESVKLFAAARLAEFAEPELLAGRLLDQWVARAREVDNTQPYHEQLKALRSLVPEVPNLRRALDHGFAGDRAADAAEVLARTFEFWLLHRALLPEGRDWLARARQAAGLSEEVRLLLDFHHAVLSRLDGDSAGVLAILQPLVDGLAEHRPREHLEALACLMTTRCTLLDPRVLADQRDWVVYARTRADEDVLTILTSGGSIMVDWGRYEEAAELCAEYLRRVWGQFGRGPSAAQLVIQLEVALGREDPAAIEDRAKELRASLETIAHPGEFESPCGAIGRSLLATGAPAEAAEFLTHWVDWFGAAYPYWLSRLTEMQLLLAESRRRTGDPAGALTALRACLTALPPAGNFDFGLGAVLVAALLAADLDDPAGSADLAGGWEVLRRRVGLPAPLGFRDAVRELGLDPAPPPGPDPGFTWSAEPFSRLVAQAADWCERSLARVGGDRPAAPDQQRHPGH